MDIIQLKRVETTVKTITEKLYISKDDFLNILEKNNIIWEYNNYYRPHCPHHLIYRLKGTNNGYGEEEKIDEDTVSQIIKDAFNIKKPGILVIAVNYVENKLHYQEKEISKIYILCEEEFVLEKIENII